MAKYNCTRDRQECSANPSWEAVSFVTTSFTLLSGKWDTRVHLTTLTQTQALAARQHVVSSWSRGRQLCTTCRVRPSSAGSLQPPFAESECVYTCACSDNGYRRAQQFFTPHHTWLYLHGNGYRVCSWHAGTDRG